MYFNVPRTLGEAPSNASPTTWPVKPRRPSGIFDQFPVGEWRLDVKKQAKIDELAEQVVRSWGSVVPIRKIQLLGHTDDTGDLDFNDRLGTQRAESVKAELAADIERRSRALSTTIDRRLTIETYSRGKREPITLNHAKRASNRRVEVFLFVSRTKTDSPTPIEDNTRRPVPVPTPIPQRPDPRIPWPTWRPQPTPIPTPWKPWWPVVPPGGATPGGRGSGALDWITTSLKAGAASLGIVVSGGVWALRKATLQNAFDAAWLVFQIEEGGLPKLMGLAGEAALEAILPDVLGIDPKFVLNLNSVELDFPVIDLINPFKPISVKNYGALSTLTGKALEDSLVSRYKNDFLDMLLEDRGRDVDRKLDKCAKYLFDNQQSLRQRGVWPKGWRGTSVQQVRKYVQQETLLGIPNNHVQMVRKEVGRHLNQLRVSGKLPVDPKWIQQQTFRMIPAGVTSDDLSAILEATKHLPVAQYQRLHSEYDQLIRAQRAKRRRP
jgi:hypothetical protein